MPIGKNAIKRVENNGYSKVSTAAPDMENSTVIANMSEEVMEKMVKPVEQKTAKKTSAKKTACKKPVAAEETMSTEKKAPEKKAATKKSAVKKPAPQKVERVEVGSELPYYLL